MNNEELRIKLGRSDLPVYITRVDAGDKLMLEDVEIHDDMILLVVDKSD